MTKDPLTTLRRNRARTLAVILLALVLHGGTAGFTHTHGRSATPRTISTEQGTTSFASGHSSLSPFKATNCVCLICQLQHNLSVTLLAKVPQLELQGTSPVSSAPTAASYFAELLEQGHGRAPPLTS